MYASCTFFYHNTGSQEAKRCILLCVFLRLSGLAFLFQLCYRAALASICKWVLDYSLCLELSSFLLHVKKKKKHKTNHPKGHGFVAILTLFLALY